MPNQKPPQKIVEDRLDSLHRQLATLWKNLNRLEEVKVQYGLDVPTKIENEIDHFEAEIERVEIEIAELESIVPVRLAPVRAWLWRFWIGQT